MNNRSLVVCIQNTRTYVNVYISTRKGVHLTILIMYYSVKIKYTSLSRDIQRNFWLLFTIFKCKKQFYSYHHKYKCTYTWEILQTISISIWDIRCFARYLKKKMWFNNRWLKNHLNTLILFYFSPRYFTLNAKSIKCFSLLKFKYILKLDLSLSSEIG